MNTYFKVSGFILGVLFLATVVVQVLLVLKPQNATFAKVKVIVKSWWIILFPFLLALAWPKWGIVILFYILSCFIVLEYFKASPFQYKKFAAVSLITLVSLHYLTICFGNYNLFLICIPLLSLFLVPGFIILRATIADLPSVFSSLYGHAFLIYYLSHIPALAAMPEKAGLNLEQATLGLVILLGLTWGNDVFQFLAGKSFGKLKIVPAVSPNKTLAGFIGGLIGTTVVAFLTLTPIMNLTLLQTLVIGPVISVTGMMGDLFFSSIKRNLGTKDFSDLLPGHGGLLDRCDSLIFTAPVFFNLLVLIQMGYL